MSLTPTPQAHRQEPRVQAIGRQLLDRARAHRSGRLSAAFWSDKLIGQALADPAFKVQLFRFVDVFPTLNSPERIHRLLAEYLTRPGVQTPKGLKAGLKAGGLLKGTMARTVARQVETMARAFIAGTDAESALPQLRRRWDLGIGFSVDRLGEACLSEAEADAYLQHNLDLIHRLPPATAAWPAQPTLDTDHLGPIPRTHLSIKLSALAAKVDPLDFDGSINRVTARLAPLLDAAARHHVFINFDMEHHQLKELTLELFRRCAQRFDTPMGLALQAYLQSGDADAARLADWARGLGRPVTIRLVKGAYWDSEVVHARQNGWPLPVWPTKARTDACFERMTRTLIDATPTHLGRGGITLALGSHNVRSIAVALAHLETRGLPPAALEVQMLYGMAEPLKHMTVDHGLRLREYTPVGQMLPGMAYLVRRLLENTSNESWLRHGFLDQTDPATLLSPPEGSPAPPEVSSAPPEVPLALLDVSPVLPAADRVSRAIPLEPPGVFVNAPPRDFADRDQRRAFATAVSTAQVPCVTQDTTEPETARAVGVARAAFGAWRDTDPVRRAAVLLNAADRMSARRDGLAAIMVHEAGKPWAEADADVCEAIDFCRFYARRAPALFEPRRGGGPPGPPGPPGETDELFHQPRGVAAVIAPWNFPLAICCGMTAAALVTGNPVIVKPAEQTPGVALRLGELLWEAGTPREALQVLPGAGAVVGAALVRDPRVALIAFTGSKAVGLDILRAAAATPDGQGHIKKVIAEMGGKNAIIVDDTADLDEAVAGVRRSAFGYAGQKCSACSRVIVLDAVHDAFVSRLVGACRALILGDPADPATDLGPVIDAKAARKIRQYIDIGRTEGSTELAVTGTGQLIGPHIFSGIAPDHCLAQEEVFGPVLAVMRASDFDAALTMANASAFKLTGGLYSRTPSHLDRARACFGVGNLYLNRAITGALVGRQPFGGFGLSGTGTQAGGDDYLRHFVEPRTVTENTLRQGFSPDLT